MAIRRMQPAKSPRQAPRPKIATAIAASMTVSSRQLHTAQRCILFIPYRMVPDRSVPMTLCPASTGLLSGRPNNQRPKPSALLLRALSRDQRSGPRARCFGMIAFACRRRRAFLMLPFSCPFGATKSGKRQQTPAQGEGRELQDSMSDDARSGRVWHIAAKDG